MIAMAAVLGAAAAWSLRPGVPTAMTAGGISGSAFAVAPGMLVTNAHVALRCRAQGLPLRVQGRGGWEVSLLDPEADLALLRGPSGSGMVLALSAALRLPRGTPLLAMGYPTAGTEGRLAGQLQGRQGRLLRATLTVHDPEGGQATSFVMADHLGRELEPSWEDGLRYFGAGQEARLRWRLEIDAPSAGGSSGGPVLDAAGQVVGVVYAGGRGLTAAIPLEDLRALLARAGVAPVLGSFFPQGLPDWEAVQASAARALSRITC
ncbi:S1 family peptidase [Roseomonas marmotae]|uniref:Trypsin-like peptidase domain-containing protein n=2 Tax=Roseomonas marmotae TaxID=2768161 RepID=A0ABS3KFA1_9PROT|nr:serine protease [Roseomonas marmotae]MBO1076149.1 trypsin-like peptidase domain-containing protein [Roseomonas marmotae]